MISKKLFDEALTYQTSLLKYEQGVVDKVLALMLATDLDMTTKLVEYSGKGSFTSKWLQTVTGNIKAHIAASGSKNYEYLANELSQLAQIVVNKELKILESGLPLAPLKGPMAANLFENNVVVTDNVAHYNFAKPSVEQLVAISETTPIQGQLLKKWFDNIDTNKQLDVIKNIRLGMIEGQTIEQMVQRLAGTKAENYTNGVLAISRRHAEAVARTAVNNVSNQATHLTYQANKDIIKGWKFLATLDGRTTLTCASLSGTTWPIGSGPIPPRHIRCRSFQLPEVKTWKELGVDIDEMPDSMRASKDGLVKADISFQDWLKGQPPAVRQEILGAERMKLFDAGTMDLQDFTNKRGQVYSLQTLKGKYPDAMDGVKVQNVNGVVLAGQKLAPVYEDFKAPNWDGAKLTKLEGITKKVSTDFNALIDELVGGPTPDVSNLIPDTVLPWEQTVKGSLNIDALKTTYSDTHIKNILPKINEFVDAFDTGGVDAVKLVASQYKSIYLGGIKKALNLVGAPSDMMDAVDEILVYGKAVTKAEMATKKVAAMSQTVADTAQAVMENKVAPTPHISQFQKTGGKLGSNEGGTYKNLLTGEQWYIKNPASLDMAQNEVMASKLYKLAGADATELHFIDMGSGKWGVGSKWVDGLDVNPQLLKSGMLDGVNNHFATDAWLANWDVVGLGYDNLKVLNGVKAVRVDPGGALYYRAQGGLKVDFKAGSFGPHVEEIKTLLDVKLNAKSAEVFGSITQKEMLESVARVLRISEHDIRSVVNEAGSLWPQAKRDELINILLQRQEDLQKQFPQLVKVKVAPPTGRITAEDIGAIYKGRSNGYAIRTDYDQIEDQQILWHIEKQKNGADNVVGTLKVREEGVKTLNQYIVQAGGIQAELPKVWDIKGFTQDVSDSTYELLLKAVKGINAQLKDVNVYAIRDVDVERAQAALKALKALPKKAIDTLNYPWKEYQELMETVITRGEGATLTKGHLPSAMLNKYNAGYTVPTPDVVSLSNDIMFVKKKGVYTRSDIKNGFIERTGAENSFTVGSTKNDYFEANIDGVKVKYWQIGDSDASWTMQGRVQIITDGASEQAVNKALKTLERLGLNVDAPLASYAEEMYLNKIAYSLNNKSSYSQILADVGNLSTSEEKVITWKEYLNKELGYDITKLKTYNPDGQMELWNQGQRVFLRPDLQGPEWDEFTSKFVLRHQQWHNNNYDMAVENILNSGSKLASNADRVRRGIPWNDTSASADFESGGAEMVFTRIIKKDATGDGFYWKADNHLRRTDAISYDSDRFGKTYAEGEPDYVSKYRRASKANEFGRMADHGKNETVFKNGLSIFDDLIKLVVPANEYDAVIASFKKHGWDRFPSSPDFPKGRALTDVIKKR